MIRIYSNFIKGISVNRIGLIGVILTTTAFISFVVFEFFRLAGILNNAYVGLITYLLFPMLFVAGLILIPFGWRKYRKTRQKTTRELLTERFDSKDVEATRVGSRVFLIIMVLTGINVLFIIGAGFRTLKFMDESYFCGTACHKVMNPEWTTYQASPHARVRCVDCHVGTGVKALVDSKLSGLRQMVKAAMGTYEKPIPTPVHNLRPARETCEKCHWPEKFYGFRLKILTRFDINETSTPHYVTLDLKIDTGKIATKSGIHWHISTENEVRYASIDDNRNQMLWVDAKQKNGSFKRYTNKNNLTRGIETDIEWPNMRVMDCVDCHNRATHIYESPEKAVDDRLNKKQADRSLPYARREMATAVLMKYNNKENAMNGIANHLNQFYQRLYPKIYSQKKTAIDNMIKITQEIYNRNIHPTMKIKWGTYPSFLGHDQNSGCFRCHNENMMDKSGTPLSFDCTLCHSILSYDGDNPFKYLETPDPKSPDYLMHKLLREEFLTQK